MRASQSRALVLGGRHYPQSITTEACGHDLTAGSQFRPAPGHAYAPTAWNFYTPIVGSGGPNAPAESPDYPALPVLVTPNVAAYREVSALLSKDPTRAPGAAEYTVEPLTRAELGTAQVRVAAAPVAGSAGDNYEVVLYAAWLDVYGIEKPRPAEVAELRMERLGDGALRLTFAGLPSSELYNVYAGRLASLPDYTHGGPDGRTWCNVPTSAAGGGRRAATIPALEVPSFDAYFLVTGRVDGVERPAGHASDGTERDRSENTCP